MLAIIVGAASALLTLLAALVALPKIRAQARLANTEADDKINSRLYREIQRLDGEMKEMREELATVKRQAIDEKAALEKDNQRLKHEVSSLRRRVAQLEDIIKTKTTPEDMRALLAEIDRKTAKRS